MNRKAQETIKEYHMLKQGDTVTAAVSGGADSVALLDFLCSLTNLSLKVRACHLNHCLRAQESDRDEQFVRTMCREYGVPLEVQRVQVRPIAKQKGISLEMAAREVRYAFFAQQVQQYGGVVATAHTLSDTAETVLFNIARGTAMTGLCGIPPVRDYLIRPLIACSRAQIEQYCLDHGLCYVTDSSNLSDDYTRNYVRHHVLPQLMQVHPDALGAIGRMTAWMRRDADFLDGLAIESYHRAQREDGLDAQLLAELHPAIRSRVLAILMEEHQIERSADRISRAERMVLGDRQHVFQTACSQYIVLKDGVLRVQLRKKKHPEPITPKALQKNQLDGLQLVLDCGKTVEFSVLNCADYEIFENNTKLVLKNAIDYDRIKNEIFLRSRSPGDRIRQAGRGCSKSLKKLFGELALSDREHRCILCDDEGVLFAEGAGVDERVKVTPATQKILSIVITDVKTKEKRA